MFITFGIAVASSGNIYISDMSNNRIREVNTSGVLSTVVGNGTEGYSGDGGAATSAEHYLPWSVAVDSSGNIYIGDTNNSRIREEKRSEQSICARPKYRWCFGNAVITSIED